MGAPNSGKTTLFNALTGLRAKVANYPGVTVEQREARLARSQRDATLIDLPGTYSLTPVSADEAVVADLLAGRLVGSPAPHALIVTADACSLERSLLLVAQVLRLGLPTCLVVTMVDELRARGGRLDTEALSTALGIPVVGVVGNRGVGLEELRNLLDTPERWSVPVIRPPESGPERDGWGASVLARADWRCPEADRLSRRIDAILLHPVWGVLVFLAVMLVFFQMIFAWAAPAMDWIDAAVGSAASLVRGALPAGLVADFFADGIIAGVGSVVIFLPQIVLLFALLTFLEGLGYMARAAFVVDRAMARVGLEGRAFVALLSSYACAVPGIMATRSVPSPRLRLVTILVAPLMTCSARLPVYALLIGAFVPVDARVGPLGAQGLALFGLYLLGGAAALFAAWILRRTVGKGEGLPFYLELPPYRWPRLASVAGQVWDRAKSFLKRAGTIILAAAIVLWALLNFPDHPAPPDTPPELAGRIAIENSYAGRIGHAIEPWIAPLGFDWKIGVGLVASLAAREVIVATLAQVYAVSDGEGSLREAVRADRDPDTGAPVFTPATVASLLVFFVFALQCTSTLAVIARETGSWRWPAFAFGYLLALAYAASFATYRVTLALT
ncbi:MAG: ferrous iron transporter B [Myxococcales bacterium]|nr:ferrous iron transporter B [Myxococcales bacterium]